MTKGELNVHFVKDAKEVEEHVNKKVNSRPAPTTSACAGT
jgi:hypothetical protein